MVVGGYFPNWAQYRAHPYGPFTPGNVTDDLAKTMTHFFYGFIAFCPPPGETDLPYWVTQLGACKGKQPYDLTTLEPNDVKFIPEAVALKSKNPKLKVVASIGGWNFPSHYWSKAVSTAAGRTYLTKSVIDFVNKNMFDGIDIDWEYPCSAKRTNLVKITCQKFDKVNDAGGDCVSG